MAFYRYSCKGCVVALAGTVHTHGLPAIPDEWAVNLRGPGAGSTYVYVTTVTATSITIACAGAAGTCDVFANVNHSIVE